MVCDAQSPPSKVTSASPCTPQPLHSGHSGQAPCSSSRAKDGARTVNAWREQWRQLGLQAWSSDSDSRRETQNPRSLSLEQLEDIRSTLKKGEDDFRGWEGELWGGLTKVRKRMQVLARNIHFAPQQGDIRRMVQAAEHDLRIFAEQTQQEEDELAALECSLQDTLESSLARFEGWCSQESSLRKPAGPDTPIKTSRPPSCSRSRQAGAAANKEAKELDSMHEQVDKLDAEIAKDGGSSGSWSCDDHDTFLKVFSKFRKRTGVEFIQEAQELLPDKRHEDLVGHIKWMHLYEDRQIQRKQLVEKWRCMRAVVSPAREASAEPKHALTAAAARQEKQQRASSRERVQKELNERRQRAADWRRGKNEEQRGKQEEQQRRLEEAKLREARERRRQSEQKHKAIEASKEQRMADEALIRSAASAPNAGRPMSGEDKKRIAERNAVLLQRRVAHVQARRSEASDSQCFDPPSRSSSVGAIQAAYRNVESRLEESTKLYVDRSREMREDPSTMGHSASSINGRGVVPGNFAHQGVVRTLRKAPSWRPHLGA